MKFEINNSHYILTADNGIKLLIDTGSPTSFGNVGEIQLGARTYNVAPDENMLEKINDSQLFEGDIDVLIGMNILVNHRFDFNKDTLEVIIDGEADTSFTHVMPFEISCMMGQNYISSHVHINGISVNTIIDSGAKISYLSPAYIDHIETVGEIHDYNPLLGDINTTTHNVTLGIDSYSSIINVALMPKLLNLMLNMINVDFLMGIDAIKTNRLCLDFMKKQLCFM